jgi:hypothetical protein
VADIVEEHRRRNESTRHGWETMAAHRARVTRLISAVRGDCGRSLCVLGAGNVNDVDLVELANEFDRIALVDIDGQALLHAVERLPPTVTQKIEQFAGIDLSGIVSRLEAWPAEPGPAGADLAGAIEDARCAPLPGLGTFDVVVSTCVLTQLIDSIYLAVKAEHPLRQALVLAVRNRHLEIMIELLKPGGAGVLITDFVATDTAPEMTQLSDAQFPAAAIEWINRRNFFTGANPYAICDHLQSRPQSATDVHNVEVWPAWRWDIGAKQMAASAVTFRT